MSDKRPARTSSVPSIVDATPDRAERPRKQVRQVVTTPSRSEDPSRIVKLEQTPSQGFHSEFLKKRITDSLRERPNLLNKFISANQETPSKASVPNPFNSSNAEDSSLIEDAITGQDNLDVLAPRLIVYQLTLKNFKSYAGTQIIGPFHPSFSSIVGPNGSGKSNVIDALLFVFGFRASKLRQTKASALIHKSAAHPSLDSCDVEIVFKEVDPDSNYIDGSELSIRRSAYKNNVSKYFLNNVESSFSTVSNVLKERGIDLNHKRFLILQGEVESIAQMKPKAMTENDDGLLEYLEDIIGTSKYKPIIEEKINELSTLNDVCNEKENRFNLVVAERNKLESSKNEVLDILRDENNLYRKLHTLYQLNLFELNSKKVLITNMLQKLEDSYKSKNANFEENEKVVFEMTEELTQLKSKVQDLKNSNRAEKRERQRYEQQAVKIEEKLKHLSSKQKKTQKQLETLSANKSELQYSLDTHDDVHQRLTQEIEEISSKLSSEEDQLNKIRESLRGKTEGISNAIEEKQKLMAPSEKKVNELNSVKQVTKAELDMLFEQEKSLNEEQQNAKSSLENLIAEQKEKTLLLNSKKNHHNTIKKDSQSLERNISDLRRKKSELHRVIAQSRVKLEEMKATLSSSRSRGNVLGGLQTLHDSGQLEGFHGRLGDLGTIDSKYDVAISTACPALNHIVVDSLEVGQKCIAFLRSNNLGRSSFIVLRALQERNLKPIQTPENVPRLFDLLHFKNEIFAPAFFSVLQNTLVADNLEQANRIAFGKTRWRVVTLSGQLIDKSGTMTGGGTRVKQGGMASQLPSDISPVSLSNAEDQTTDAENRHRQVSEELVALLEKSDELKNEAPCLELEISKLHLDLSAFNNLVEGAKNQVSNSRKALKEERSLQERKQKLTGDLTKLDQQIDNIKASNGGLVAEVRELQDKIMQIGGIKYRIQKSKVDDLHEQHKYIKEKLTNVSFEKRKNEQRVHSIIGELESLQSDFSTTQKELETNETDFNLLRGKIKDYTTKIDELSNSIHDINDSINELNNRIDFESKEINSMKAERLDLENKLTEQKTAHSDVLHNEKKLQKLLSELILHDLREYDQSEARAPEFQEFSEDELASMNKQSLYEGISEFKKKTEEKEVDVGVLQSYLRCTKEVEKRASDFEADTRKRNNVKQTVTDLQTQRLDEFMEGFGNISQKLKAMYQIITMGGNAELELVDSLDPFSEGVLFSIMPPKKSWKNISNLSGGEKTLSSLALVFALHSYKPTPLYVMDEIDAALDFKNVSIVANYIKERTKNAQFIVISLRSNMFELSSRLVGIYKTANMTKSVTINNRDLQVNAEKDSDHSPSQVN
ncbi:condensin complex subunit Cut3 [Schizosaccharomyces cryophilus OY26]|uniref:Structural maintenance of chromosomes protein n=1 Tax=Schizosaccharomyces cryophilus (strain OY26 / ATCC MYA-4695 / CBS 11777 / NBRC 106824 / NRRL Y48691) TaxID=653667 RepID=S9W2R5_SCHCR|nr:condensin complex subunit Cut3 [Schizosaccharomyces cryophilus OY26]EPY54323.1 condensin complex subunit Cut3 [Schizosaccharomyces cryophilus OY26]